MVIEHPAQILFSSQHPLTREFDMEFLSHKENVLEVRASAPQNFANGDGKSVHSGFTTLFLDTVMGSVVLGSIQPVQPIATIKLTNQQFRQMNIGENVICRARFDGQHDDIAFVTAEVTNQKTGDLLATAVGTFMIGTRTKPFVSSVRPEG